MDKLVLNGFEETYKPEIINQAIVGDIIRKQLNTNDDLEFVKYVEKKNKIKFTCKTDEAIFYGKVDIIAGQGISRKIERYPLFRNSTDYEDIVKELYKKGKTQKQIANRLCLSQATISRMINK